MRHVTIVTLVALCPISASGAVHAVLPGCCSPILWSLAVMNAATGGVEHVFTVPGELGGGTGGARVRLRRFGTQTLTVTLSSTGLSLGTTFSLTPDGQYIYATFPQLP